MPRAKKNQQRGRPAASRLSPGGSRKVRSRSRVKYIHVRLGFSRQLNISLRKFRLNKNRASKKYRQKIINIRLFSVRQVAIAIIKNKKPVRTLAASHIHINKPRLRYALPLTLMVIGIVGTAYSGMHMTKSVRLDLSPSSKASASGVVISSEVGKAKVMPRSLPAQIKIPSIGVDTSVVPVGLDQDGAIAMPQSVDIAAWYSGSPTPGEKGPAIIAGHVDNYKGIGAFFRLRETQVGDLIYIDRADGTTATFKVADIKEVPQANFPTQEVFGNINYAGLRVITCGGYFNTATHEYEDNIVVFAILQ